MILKALEVRKEVNLWADKETNGLIKEILPQGSINNLTKLIFANALYFKGVWNESFPRRMTYDYDFHLLNGNSVKVPFMTNKNKQFIRAFDGYKVLRLLYKKGEDKRQFYMDIFLPNQKNGLPDLVKKVASKPELLCQKLPSEKVEVGRFRIPKFKFTFGLETSHALKELGVILPFAEGGLTKMVVDSFEGKQLYVSNIFQKSFIEVNEEGTEAAAVTAAIIKTRGMCMSTELDFIADHPFLFLIGEVSTSTILFMGHMLNPLVGGS
jgi:serpin B